MGAAIRWTLAALVIVPGALVGAGPAVTAAAAAAPAAAPPDFLGTLVGASQAAMYPSGVEIDRVHDRLVVADTGRDRVLFYSFSGTPQGGFGEYGTADGQFASPRDVAVDGAGSIYVADAENNRIQKFSSTGVHQWTRGGLAQGAATLNTPIGVTWDEQYDQLLVASTGQSLIKAYGADGTRRWTSPTGDALGAHGMRDVARGPDGRLWVTAYKEHQIKAYDVDATGNISDITPVRVLGTGNGSGDGQMNFPYNVVFSSDGDTAFVSDTGNGRIARWDISAAQPQWLTPWGGRCTMHPQPCPDPSAGEQEGSFNHLRRVAIDESGDVYAADFWGGGFWVFEPDGAVSQAIEGASAPLPGVAEPYAVDVSPVSGQVYVMDRLNHRIQRFQPGGAYIAPAVGARGTQLGTFSWPEGLTVAPTGEAWAVDTRGDRIERFSASLSATGVIARGSTGSGAQNLNYPSNADVAANGVVWVVDTRNHRLQRFDPTANTWSSVGSQGTGAGEFQDPMGVAVTPTAVYVADTGNDRVVKLAHDGSQQASYDAGLDGPEGIEVAADGTVWVADTQHSRIVHLAADLSTDLGDGFGSFGTGDTQFFNPHDLAIGHDRLYVADTYNNRVQVFSLPSGSVDPPEEPLTPAYAGQISDEGGRAPVYPAGVEIVDGIWYVADSGGSRIVTVDPTTGAVAPVAESGLNDPRDLELDAADPTALWVTDTGGNRIVRLSRTGQQLGTLTGLNQPYGLANDATRVYVANTYGSPASVKAYTRAGATAWTQTTCNGTAFSRPRDVGLGDNGQVLVADTDNHRIVVLDAATGSCVRAFGSNGSGAGQFKSPRSVSADGSGGVWVADAFNYRVQHLTMTGTTIGSAMPAGTNGDGPMQFRSPHCVTPVPGTTEVAVCDTFNFRIPVYDGSGSAPAYDRTIGGTKPANGGFNGAFAVAYGQDGSLYVADWFNHRVQKFDADGAFVTQWGGYGPQPGGLIFPRGILVSPDGEVVVTDSENNRIDVFTQGGAFLRSVKPKTGTALSRPHQTALDGTGGYWIADTNNSRIIHLDSDGDVVGTATAVAGKPEGIAVDNDGSVLVSNTQNNRVERYTANGSLVGTAVGSGQVNKPGGLLVTGTGADRRLWIASAGNDRVVVVDVDGQTKTFGTAGGGDGQLEQPRAVAFDAARDRIAVADFGNDRLSLWDPHGDPPPVDDVDPTVTVSTPLSGATVPAGTLAVTGTAGDNTSVSSVEVAIQRPGGQWLQANGTWGSAQEYVAATLDVPGAGSTGWWLSFSAAHAGSYAMTARATDQSGNNGTASRTFTVAAADGVAPETVLTAPATNAIVAPPTTSASGSATDNVGVASVTILVKDRDTGLWLQNNGTWGSTTAAAGRPATLGSAGAASTSWTIDVPLGVGNYLITARARDAAGSQDATAAQKQFSVRVADSVAPDGTITAPANNATLPMGPVAMTGNATDNTGVDQVLLAIQDTVSKEYLRANGTWTAQYGTVAATVANRGAASTGWSYTFMPPVARTYAVTAIASDAAGNQDATKPRNVFTVR